jgi:NADP-reducing hydrogenase subunit HndB
MKSLEDLKKLRDEMSSKLSLRNTKDGMRVVVGMATCGITAGARPVLSTLLEEVSKRNIENVIVTQVGCIGECALEPIVEVYDDRGHRTTYAKVTPEIAKMIVETHLVNKQILQEQLIEKFK